MPWQSLGTIALNYDWQVFPNTAIDTETFRVTMPPLLTVDGSVLITQYFADGGRAASKRYYPTDEPYLMSLVIPKDFRDKGLIVRYVQAKLANRSRVFSGQTWQIELEAFY